jgi:GxxExxY protein
MPVPRTLQTINAGRVTGGLPNSIWDMKIESGMRADLLVDNLVIVEIKAVEKLAPVHQAQLLTYLKLTEKNLAC